MSCLLAVAAPAAAQSIEGAVRLGAEVGLIEYESSSASIDGSSVDSEVTHTSVGVVPADLGFNVGYGTSDGVVVGLRALLGIQSTKVSTSGSSGLLGTSDSASTASETAVQLMPYVEGVFAEGQPTRFFVGGTMGLIAGSSSGDTLETSRTSFAFGGLVGLHQFLGTAGSIDPTLYLLYYTGSADVTGDSFGDAPSTDVSGVLFGIVFGASAWAGPTAPGSGREPSEPESFGTGYDPSAYSGTPAPRARPSPRARPGLRRPSNSPLIDESTVIDGVRVHFLGQPDINRSQAALRFTRYASAPELANCKQLVLTIDGAPESHALQYKPRYSGAAVEELAQAQVELGVIERIANGQSVTADLCGITRTFDPRAKSTAHVFLERFRHKLGTTEGTAPAAAPGVAPPAAPGAVPAPPAPGAAPPAATPGAAPAAPPPSTAPAPAPGATPAPAPGAATPAR